MTRSALATLMLIAMSGCAISTGPLAPEGDPTPSGAELSPAPNPVAGMESGEEQDFGADLQKALQTSDRMAALAAALRAYHSDNGSYPVASNARELAQILAPRYVESLESTDGWKQPFRYQLRDGGQSYVLVSPGSDNVADESSWEVSADLTNPSQDIVVRDGAFVRAWPRD